VIIYEIGSYPGTRISTRHAPTTSEQISPIGTITD
jgi:hypothetical protein